MAWIIVACIGFTIIAGAIRGRAGVAVADAGLLVILLGLIGIVNLVIRRFFDTGEIAWTLAGLVAFGFALDALYGLMAPTRQRHRDQWLRARMRRKRA
ncbi:MAG: hypothetical protein H0V46_03035 [Sphingomonas sp.]|nr:hypothetical protein [Sphingomonas sp.]